MEIQSLDYTAPDASATFVSSLRDSGFAVLSNHPIPRSLMDRIYADWLCFFFDDERREYLFDADGEFGVQEGLVPADVSETAVGQKNKDLKEFYNLTPGGRIPPALRDDILEYRRRALTLGIELIRWIQSHLPQTVIDELSEPLEQMLSDHDSLLRVVHYPPVADTTRLEGIRAAPHEDINMITLLPASEQPGLQVKGLDGTWYDLASRAGDLIINVGDMLQEATSHYIPSTTHQVVNPIRIEDNISRIAVPYFLGAKPDAVLSQRYTAGAYKAERLRILNPDLAS